MPTRAGVNRKPPLLLVRGGAAVVAAAAAEMRTRGWVVRAGWGLPPGAWNLSTLICTGVVRRTEDARNVVLAAARGAGIIAALEAPESVVADLHDDLRRIGKVELRDPARPAGGLDRLNEEQRQMVALLAQGYSLDEIAKDLNYSRRTVSRRLGEVRQVLGLGTNAEVAVMHASDEA